MRKVVIAALLIFSIGGANAQWTPQPSHTEANLRGVHYAGKGIAWASGAEGTVLRTVDDGAHWQACTTPPGAEKLDFRGVWAWDEDNAIVMSAGPEEQSRLYTTSDGCHSWKETNRNTDKDGFWDAMVFESQDFGFIGDAKTGVLIGDPVKGHFETEAMLLGHGWFIDGSSCAAKDGEAAFAASNSSVFVFGSRRYAIGTGGKAGPRVLLSPLLVYRMDSKPCLEVPVPLASGNESSGVFSLVFRDLKHGVAVGGDYKQPGSSSGTAAVTSDGGRHWNASTTPPAGYRSAVAWDSSAKVWIAAGTNGSDYSTDNGKTWHPLDNGNWNALSLPFVVGPKGRIAKLESAAVKK